MQAEIERLKIEITTLRNSPIHTPAAIKGVTLVAGIKDWTGTLRADLYMNFSHRSKRRQRLAIGQRMRRL
jgi:hypothetical protein